MTSEIRPNYYKVKVPVRYADGTPISGGQVECFDLIDALEMDFYQGNALKYLFRAGRKTESKVEDMRKVHTYIKQWLERNA